MGFSKASSYLKEPARSSHEPSGSSQEASGSSLEAPESFQTHSGSSQNADAFWELPECSWELPEAFWELIPFAEAFGISDDILRDQIFEKTPKALLEKLVEEAQEIASAEAGDMVKEVADLYEVIDALLVALDLNKDAVLAIQKKRCEERGGFEKRIKLLWTD